MVYIQGAFDVCVCVCMHQRAHVVSVCLNVCSCLCWSLATPLCKTNFFQTPAVRYVLSEHQNRTLTPLGLVLGWCRQSLTRRTHWLPELLMCFWLAGCVCPLRYGNAALLQPWARARGRPINITRDRLMIGAIISSLPVLSPCSSLPGDLQLGPTLSSLPPLLLGSLPRPSAWRSMGRAPTLPNADVLPGGCTTYTLSTGDRWSHLFFSFCFI